MANLLNDSEDGDYFYDSSGGSALYLSENIDGFVSKQHARDVYLRHDFSKDQKISELRQKIATVEKQIHASNKNAKEMNKQIKQLTDSCSYLRIDNKLHNNLKSLNIEIKEKSKKLQFTIADKEQKARKTKDFKKDKKTEYGKKGMFQAKYREMQVSVEELTEQIQLLKMEDEKLQAGINDILEKKVLVFKSVRGLNDGESQTDESYTVENDCQTEDEFTSKHVNTIKNSSENDEMTKEKLKAERTENENSYQQETSSEDCMVSIVRLPDEEVESFLLMKEWTIPKEFVRKRLLPKGNNELTSLINHHQSETRAGNDSQQTSWRMCFDGFSTYMFKKLVNIPSTVWKGLPKRLPTLRSASMAGWLLDKKHERQRYSESCADRMPVISGTEESKTSHTVDITEQDHATETTTEQQSSKLDLISEKLNSTNENEKGGAINNEWESISLS